MDAFTAQELARLRNHPQHFRPRLAVFQPKTMWSGTLNGVHDKGAIQLTVTTLTGSLDDVLPDTTLIVDEGINEQRLRIRSVTGSTIDIGENPIDWVAGVALKALLYFEPFAVFNRIVNSDGIIAYFEDYDVGYVDQNENFEPVVNIGPAAYVVELDCETSGTFSQLEIDASADSFVFGDTIASYDWDILRPSDFSPVPELTEVGATGTFRFYSPDDYYISCTITTTSGKSYTGYRPVLVRCITDGQSGSPFFDVSINSLEGSRDTGYWTASISVFEDCNVSDFPRNVPVVIYGTAAYGEGAARSTEQVPWHYDNVAHQRFVGWIREEGWIEYFVDKGRAVVFGAVGLGGLLDDLRNYPAWLQSVDDPSIWTGMNGLNVDRMLYYYLKQRSTVLRLTDWHRTGDTRLMQYAEVPAGKMYSGLKEFLAGTIFGELVSDRQSALWAELDGQLLQDAERPTVVTSVQTLTDADHMDEVNIPTTRDRPEIAWLSIDGLHYDGTSNTPIIAYAPGYVISARGGDLEEISGLVLESSQAFINTLAGRLYAIRNNPFKVISYTAQGVYPYDIAPQANMEYSGLQSGTFREETITELDLLIRDITDSFSPTSFVTSRLELEATIRDEDAVVGPNVPKAVSGVEGLFPPEVTGPDPDDFNLSWPDSWFNWPGFETPVGENAAAPPGVRAGTDTIAAFNNDNNIYLTGNWNDAEPVWSQRSMGLDGGDDFLRVEVDPGSPLYIGTGNKVNVWVIGEDKIYYLEDVFERDGAMTTTMQHTFNVANIDDREMHAQLAINGKVAVSSKYKSNGGFPGTWVASTVDRGQTWNEVQVTAFRSTRIGVVEEGPGCYVSHKFDGRIYTIAAIATALDPNREVYESLDNGVTWAAKPSLGLANLFRYYYTLHVPIDDNPNDTTFYFGGRSGTKDRTWRMEGGVATEITPQVAGVDVGPSTAGQWVLHTYPLDRQIVLMNARDLLAGTFHILTSDDAGDSWTLRDTISDYRFGGISGNNPDVAYLCGEAAIGFVTDMLTDFTIQDKLGNIPTDFPGVGKFHFLVGG